MSDEKRQILITGTGRAGTTFLVELLTHLGLDTGFRPHETATHIDKISNAGLEHRMTDPCSPYIVKDPSFSEYADEILERSEVFIEHVFIPLRDIESVAESRRSNQKKHLKAFSLLEKFRFLKTPYLLYGGLLHTQSTKRGVQERVLMKKLYDLLLTLSKHQIPVTFIQFPFFLSTPDYLFEKLAPILSEISYEKFREAFETLADPNKPQLFELKKGRTS